MTSATWTGRADTRSVTKERDVATAGKAASDHFELLRRQSAVWARGADATGRNLMQQGLGILNGLAPAVFDRTGNVVAPTADAKSAQTAALRPSRDGKPTAVHNPTRSV